MGDSGLEVCIYMQTIMPNWPMMSSFPLSVRQTLPDKTKWPTVILPFSYDLQLHLALAFSVGLFIQVVQHW